uniref:WAPL domain-containing protein n=1 Tax=Anopheles atroparvus TaxID=41427 RepID=A0A182JGR7_ANOAO
MSKWNKPQGVVVPLESLLKERRKENCPAPRRSAGLVGRWGITSFTSIRNRGYVVDYGNVNPKEPGLELGTGAGDSPEAMANMLGSPVAEPARPRKFFKSRNTVLPPPLPPGEHHLHAGFATHHSPFEASPGVGASDVWNHANATPPQHFYQHQQLPLSAATPQLSPTGPQSANVGGLLHAGTTDGMLAYGVPPQALALPPVKEKAPRKKKQATDAAGDGGAGRKSVGRAPGKKEKKEKKPKRARRDVVEPGSGSASGTGTEASESQPKRNSSRIRNRVVNYNEDEEDSNDYDRTRSVLSRAQPTESTSNIGLARDSSFLDVAEQQQDPHVSTAAFRMPPSECSPRETSSGDGCIEPLSGSEGRSGEKPATASCLPSPSITEHRPILLRISKGISMLITDNDELPNVNQTQQQQQQQQQQQFVPDEDGALGAGDVNTSEPFPSALSVASAVAEKAPRSYHEQQQEQQVVFPADDTLPLPAPRIAGHAAPCGASSGTAGSDVAPLPKTELKIKISLGGKPLISSTTEGKGGNKSSSSKYNFKKRAIERERARHHLSSKRHKLLADAAGCAEHGTRANDTGVDRAAEEESGRRWLSHGSDVTATSPLAPPPPPPVSSSTMSSPNYTQQQQHPRQQPTVAIAEPSGGESAAAAGAGSGRGAIGGSAPQARHSFPLPGTDTYEVFRTLSSLSGGDDFDSQSSILGSASSDNNTPKHTLQAPGEDCQIIHSRGSSDCGSDLELSQNSSTAAAPPSDVYSEGENTQDHHNHHQQQQLNAPCFSTPPAAAVVVAPTKPVSFTPPAAADVVVSQSASLGFDERQQQQQQQTEERVEVLKINIAHAAGKSADGAARRVTRNKTRQQAPPADQQPPAKQITLRGTGRSVRSRSNNNNNNNNNVIGSSSAASEKRPRKRELEEPDTAAVATTTTAQQQQPAASARETDELLRTADEEEVNKLKQMYQPERDDGGGAGSLRTSSVASATGATPPLQTASPGPKPAVTRQYSRKKKNVVPADYLAAADTTAALEMTALPAANSGGVQSPAASSTTGDFFAAGAAAATSSSTAARYHVPRQNGELAQEQPGQQQPAQASNSEREAVGALYRKSHPDDTQAAGAGSAPVPAAAAAATVGAPAPAPPAPMRLVLQKKGTIFKSRPLVGSSAGATDTKKRHVYKHKWDDNGGSSSDQQAGAGGVGGIAGGDGSAGGGSACGGVVSSTGGGGGGGGGGSGIGGNCIDSGATLPGYVSSDVGRGDAASDDDGGGGGGGGGSNGAIGSAGGGGGLSLLEYDNDFDCETTGGAPLGVGGMAPPRSKRLRAGSNAASGNGGTVAVATAGASGVAGNATGGMGAGGSTGSASAFGALDVFGSSHHHGYHHEYDADSSGYSDDRPDAAAGGGDESGAAKTRCERSAKPYYTIVRNVKNSHQMQEIGEFQEMDDDVEYILSALQPDNPVSTRCLSALQLATKCMKPAFKMHVRAHGVVTRFFKALSDAYQDASLGLCTAAIMYVFSQDKLNMDLDRDSLELMLNLLDTDHRPDAVSQQGQGQLQKIRQRVKELCEEIKGVGKVKHIDTEHVTAGSLAMESLLSLTSQRAGEWFKDELRNLGGIEHLIKTVVECDERVPGRASDWNEEDVARLRKIERCLRVLNNVSLCNRANQRFLLEHRDGLLVQVLVKMYRQFDVNMVLFPTNDASPKESTGVVLRELLQPILHMLITLTHSYDEEAHGAQLVGRQPEVINITMHLLLRIAEHVPPRCVFDFHLLVLTLLLHLARPSQHNRQQVLLYMDAQTGHGGIKSLVEYFEGQEEMASHAEAKTNAILETPARTVDAEDAETKLMQKAEHHMEHTYMGSHVSMLIYHLVLDEPAHEQLARLHLKHNDFRRMVAALSRYYEFLNLTTNADAESTAHKRQTKDAIDYLSGLDGCAAGVVRNSNESAATSHSTVQ